MGPYPWDRLAIRGHNSVLGGTDSRQKNPGQKMSTWEFAPRQLKRRSFCPLIFLPFSWLRLKAALGFFIIAPAMESIRAAPAGSAIASWQYFGRGLPRRRSIPTGPA